VITPLQILFLEDDPRDAALVEATLEAEGVACHITRVESEPEFFTSVEQGGFDLVFADYTLPLFDGISALKIIKELRPEVPFIFVSGTLGEEVAIEALKMGATDYVFKSRLSRIVPSVQRALREAEQKTQRKRAEEEMRTLASLVENSMDFIGMASLQGEVTFVNAAGQANLGLAGNEQVRETKIPDYIAEQDLERFENQVLPVVFKEGRWEGETLLRHFKTGASIPVWQHVFFIIDEGSGRRLALATICRDITERKRVEEVSRQAQANLARVNRVMLVGEMAASIAHEVNQPLTGILAHAGTCLRWLAAQPPNMEEARESLGLIVRDGNRAGEVIGRIRGLVEKVPPRRDRLDINNAVLEVIALTHSELQRGSVELRTRLASDLPLVAADRIQMQQLILNLIVNAIEAMSGLGDRPRELVVISGACDANDVFVEVRDSGPGFDPADLHRLFDSFYTTKSEGMGMGLSISRSIIKAHGGKLSATPNQPHGAIFRFTLPVVEDDGTS
jgi:PAS domain S-box-containing protein